MELFLNSLTGPTLDDLGNDGASYFEDMEEAMEYYYIIALFAALFVLTYPWNEN
jgi:hypothetical protein